MSSRASAIFSLGFATAMILSLFGASFAQKADSAAAAKEYKRLVSLKAALTKIPMDRQDKEPHRSFLKRNDKDIVYSEPAGTWLVRSERFWDLEAKYHRLPIADKIAWTAAENPLPGECEGYVNCYLYLIKATEGEYLTRFPKGMYAKRAVKEMIGSFSYITDDLRSADRNYTGPVDSSDRSEFIKIVRELRDILSRVSVPERTKALSQLKVIENGFD